MSRKQQNGTTEMTRQKQRLDEIHEGMVQADGEASPVPSAMERPADSPADRWRDADELRWAARHWAARMGVRTPAIHIRTMTTKWGSLSRTITHSNPGPMRTSTTISPYAGRLTLNSELLTLPRDLGEFVIVHELVHLLAPNHGRVFKSFLHAYLPDWRERERRMRGMTAR
ncbi:MAG TPA: M48 family metallopeptidase [Ktedonobacterales bacterium]|jgi:hypothetical protein|nr:M48 family metallopeptidase [Ktedonobacterales bacterium]